MKLSTHALLLLCFLAVISTVCRTEEFGYRDKEEIKKSMMFADHSSDRRVVIDNINGSIEVTSTDGNTVELIVHKTLRAESQKRLDEAKKNISVDVTQDSDRIIIYVNTPWRGENGSIHYDSDNYGYDVHCDFELKVPKRTNITLKTVNEGMIRVKGVQGNFDVRNINKSVELIDMDGSGNASTVNGDVDVEFTKNPTQESSFKTINGEVNVKFQPGLAADISMKTMNGEAYTDFPFTSLPSTPASEETHSHKRIYRSGGSFSVRIGSGGPELSFNTLNGDIYIRKNGESE